MSGHENPPTHSSPPQKKGRGRGEINVIMCRPRSYRSSLSNAELYQVLETLSRGGDVTARAIGQVMWMLLMERDDLTAAARILRAMRYA